MKAFNITPLTSNFISKISKIPVMIKEELWKQKNVDRQTDFKNLAVTCDKC